MLRRLQPLAVTLTLLVAFSMVVAGVQPIQAQSQTQTRAGASVTFSDQETNGTTVTVDSVNLSEGGYVVIHDSTLLEGDAFGSILGASSYLEPGQHSNVTVSLDRPLDSDQTLIAMAHKDTNENLVLEFNVTQGMEDGPYLANDEPVTDSAQMTVVQPTTPEEPMGNETATPTPEDNETATPTPEDNVTAPELESFEVSNLSAPASVNQSEEMVVNATVSNPNEEQTTQSVNYRLDGTVLSRFDVSLNASESKLLTLTVDTSTFSPGQHIHGLFTRDRGEIATLEVAANDSDVVENESFIVLDVLAPENATVGDTVVATGVIANPNNDTVTQEVEFRFQGDVVDRQEVTLSSYEVSNVTFSVNSTGLEPGTYYHSVFTRDLGQFEQINLSEEPGPAPPSDNETMTPEENVTEEPTTEEPTDDVTASISVSDQSIQNASLVVDSATLSEGGFLAVYQSNSDSGPGEFLGVSDFLGSGTSTDVAVPLEQPPIDNESVTVVAHMDTNDNEAFDYVTSGEMDDTPYLVDGEPVSATATVSVRPG